MTATTEPTQFTAGDLVEWNKTLGDYLPSENWALTYALVKDGKLISITASDSSDVHAVSLSAATTAAYQPGVYHWHSYVTNSGTAARYKIDSGTVEVLPNFAVFVDGYDNRSHVKKVLDALEALLEGKASKDQLSYSIAGRSLSRLSPAELLEWRDKYKTEYSKEQRAERIANGLSTSATVKVRFV